jgi:hypothetical protein
VDNLKNLNINNIDFKHCFRKDFTRIIFKELTIDRISINIIGKKGNGKTRLIRDLEKINCENIDVIYINMKEYVFNFGRMIEDIRDMVNIDETKITNNSISEVFEVADKNIYYIFCIDNYDAILQELNMDNKFNEEFFNDLNSIKNRTNVSLLCTSKIAHDKMLVYLGGKKTNRNSWITLKKWDLPEIKYYEIEMSFKNNLDKDRCNLLFDLLYNSMDELIRQIIKNEEPYSLMFFIIDQINIYDYEIKEISLKKFYKECLLKYNRLNNNGFDKSMFMFANRVKRTHKALDIDKLENPITNFILNIIDKFK